MFGSVTHNMLTQFFLRFVLKCSGQARCPLWYQFFLNLQREPRIPEPFQGSEALKCPCPYLAAGTCSPVSSIRTYLFFLFLYCHLGGVKIYFKSNPIPTSAALRAQTKPVHSRARRPHRDWARTVFGCLLWRDWGSAMAHHRGRGSGCMSPGHPACGISPLGGGRH